MALKNYIYNNHQCIINNCSEFIKLLKWFLKHGAEDCCGNDIPMFENVFDICDELDVKHEDYDYEGDDEEGGYLIKDVSELEDFLLKNINEDTLIPSEDEYPILVNWYKEESYFRGANDCVKILNFTSLKEIKPLKSYLINCTQKFRKEKNKWRKYKDKY